MLSIIYLFYTENSLFFLKSSSESICGILEENLPTDILKLVKTDFSRGENEDAPSNKRRKNQDSESREGKDGITRNGIRPLQATVGYIQTITVFNEKTLGIELAEFRPFQSVLQKFVVNLVPYSQPVVSQ